MQFDIEDEKQDFDSNINIMQAVLEEDMNKYCHQLDIYFTQLECHAKKKKTESYPDCGEIRLKKQEEDEVRKRKELLDKNTVIKNVSRNISHTKR